MTEENDTTAEAAKRRLANRLSEMKRSVRNGGSLGDVSAFKWRVDKAFIEWKLAVAKEQPNEPRERG